MPSRDHDVVLFGATGFTGRLVAQRLVERTPPGVRVALAGRSLAKLAEVRAQLGETAADWPLLLCDAADQASMARVAGSAVAVATTVGPYLRNGQPLARACAHAGTHYVDLAGEVLFMRASIDANHEEAASTGARIVHACGFDSIPSDLGVMLLARECGALGETTLVVEDLKGGLSGGTIASAREEASVAAGDPAAKAILRDPYSLTPDREAEPDLGPQPDMVKPTLDPQLGWLGPFVMASANTRVVRRTNALAGYPYGREFKYREAMGFGTGISAPPKAMGMGVGLGMLGAAMGFGPTRAGSSKVLPRPGEGPSRKDQESGRFRMRVHGSADATQGRTAVVAAQGDPGYAATSVMLAEAVLLAAVGDPDLPDRAGVLTPATGLGLPLVDRLRAAGMTLEVEGA